MSANKQAFVQTFTAQYPPRFIEVGDVDAMVDFERHVFGENAQASPLYWQTQAEDKHEDTELLVADGIIAACAHSRLRRSHTMPDRQYGEITSLGVAAQYRGHGLGAFMLRRCMDRLLEAKPTSLRLYTSVTNFRMQQLAKKHGFIIELTIPRYFRTADRIEDGYSMIYHPPSESDQ